MPCGSIHSRTQRSPHDSNTNDDEDVWHVHSLGLFVSKRRLSRRRRSLQSLYRNVYRQREQRDLPFAPQSGYGGPVESRIGRGGKESVVSGHPSESDVSV